MAGRKAPLIAYSILFFFINHIIEGSVIPLELVFEHRNYLPSAFVFVPVAIVWIYLLEYFSYQKSIRLCIILCLTFLLAAHGHTTFLRNSIFKTNISLWLDNIEKAENLHRPHHNLSKALWAAGYNNAGLKEMEKALGAKAGARKTQKVASHFNMGLFYLYQHQYDKSLAQFLKLLEILPDDPKVYQRIAMVLLAKGDLDQAEKYTLKALTLAPDAPELRRTLNLILAKKQKIDGMSGN
jgi:tetratricopeptide (TPR) repeat protein